MSLIQNTVHQTLEMSYPSALAEDNTIRATFTLDTKDGKAVALTLGGLFKGKTYIGSFAGFDSFAHDVEGEDKEAVETLLSGLSRELHESYGVPMPEPIEMEEENYG